MTPNGFSYRERLHSEPDFRAIIRYGRRHALGPFTLYRRSPTSDTASPLPEHARLGVVASRLCGKAVDRNRAKRAIREAFRHAKTRIPAGDYVVRIHRKLAAFSDADSRAAIRALFEGCAKALERSANSR